MEGMGLECSVPIRLSALVVRVSCANTGEATSSPTMKMDGKRKYCALLRWNSFAMLSFIAFAAITPAGRESAPSSGVLGSTGAGRGVDGDT